MRDNTHFKRFMNSLGMTVYDLAKAINGTYHTAKNRVDTLNFTTREYRSLSAFTSIPEEELITVVLNKKSIEKITVPYSINKQIAFQKLCADEDFIRLVIEENFGLYGIKGRRATLSEINALKKRLASKTLE